MATIINKDGFSLQYKIGVYVNLNIWDINFRGKFNIESAWLYIVMYAKEFDIPLGVAGGTANIRRSCLNFDTKELSKLWGVSPSTVRKWINNLTDWGLCKPEGKDKIIIQEWAMLDKSWTDGLKCIDV